MNITALHPLAYALAANGAYARFSDEPSLATTHACTLLEARGIRIRSVSRTLEARTGASLKPDDIDVHDGIAAARALAELGAVVTWDDPAEMRGHSFRNFRVAFAGCTVSGCAYAWEVEALLGGYLPDPWNLGLDCRTAVEQRARAALEASKHKACVHDFTERGEPCPDCGEPVYCTHPAHHSGGLGKPDICDACGEEL